MNSMLLSFSCEDPTQFGPLGICTEKTLTVYIFPVNTLLFLFLFYFLWDHYLLL